jgi:hypothetical protein
MVGHPLIADMQAVVRIGKQHISAEQLNRTAVHRNVQKGKCCIQIFLLLSSSRSPCLYEHDHDRSPQVFPAASFFFFLCFLQMLHFEPFSCHNMFTLFTIFSWLPCLNPDPVCYPEYMKATC